MPQLRPFVPGIPQPFPCRLAVGVLVAAFFAAQGSVGAAASASAPVGVARTPTPPTGVPHAPFRPDRAMARSCWSELVEILPGDGGQEEIARRTVARLLGTAHGVWLATELCRVLRDRDNGGGPGRVEVRFSSSAPECTTDGLGCFEPARPGAGLYRVFVRVQDAGADPDALVFGEYPGNPDCTVVLLYRQPESWMAETLFHELLHVWFLNARAGGGRRYPTGHGDVSRCEFDPDFLVLLDAFSRELAALEGRAPERLIPLGRTERARRH